MRYKLFKGARVKVKSQPLGSYGRKMIPPLGTRGKVLSVNRVENGQAFVQWENDFPDSYVPIINLQLIGG